MRGIRALSIMAAACAAAAVTAAPAAASPYDRDCGTAKDGFLTTDEQFESSGPWHVKMNSQTARSIARRVGPGEFQAPGSHPAAREVPCVVAQAIASFGANAWTHWAGNDGWITVKWIGYATGPSLGRFYCTGVTLHDGSVKETCVHRADRHAGRITGSFTIQRNPYYPYPTTPTTTDARWGHFKTSQWGQFRPSFSTDSVKAQIRSLDLSPPMLFPMRLPGRLANADASLDTSAY